MRLVSTFLQISLVFWRLLWILFYVHNCILSKQRQSWCRRKRVPLLVSNLHTTGLFISVFRHSKQFPLFSEKQYAWNGKESSPWCTNRFYADSLLEYVHFYNPSTPRQWQSCNLTIFEGSTFLHTGPCFTAPASEFFLLQNSCPFKKTYFYLTCLKISLSNQYSMMNFFRLAATL